MKKIANDYLQHPWHQADWGDHHQQHHANTPIAPDGIPVKFSGKPSIGIIHGVIILKETLIRIGLQMNC